MKLITVKTSKPLNLARSTVDDEDTADGMAKYIVLNKSGTETVAEAVVELSVSVMLRKYFPQSDKVIITAITVAQQLMIFLRLNAAMKDFPFPI